jgi:hypothetical protein
MRFMQTLFVCGVVLAVLSGGCSTSDNADIVTLDDLGDDIQSCQEGLDCVTDNPCVVPACEEGICVFDPIEGSCDDDDPCTENDMCTDGHCVGAVKHCDDGQWCNGLETCTPETGECGEGVPPDMDDGLECTVDECDEDNAEITHQADDALCDDDDECTVDTCGDGGCTYNAYTGECDDGDPCTINDACYNGSCAGEDKVCDDDEFCNGKESCDPDSGDCLDGESPELDDGLECTTDSCDEELDDVLHDPVDDACDDGNQCTTDTCDLESGCVFENLPGACDDGDACTDDDTCVEGVCEPGEWICFEICDNEIDDDLDELTDCEDSDCEFALNCMEDGETCVTAYLLNEGQPFQAGGVIDFAATTLDKSNDMSGSCSVASGVAPEMVHTLVIGEPLGLTITVDLDGESWPSVYVLDESCSKEHFCDATMSTAAFDTVTVLAPGIYNIVVDGNFVDNDGIGDQGDYTLHIETFEPAAIETGCTNGIDDDGDGKVDCDDKDCEGAVQCIVQSGETCMDAAVLFAEPVADTGMPVVTSFAGSTDKMKDDLEGSCDVDTQNAPDMVFMLELADGMWLDAAADFEGILYPALYLLDEFCSDGEELECTKAFEEAAEISLPLPAGTYYLVVDGAYGTDAGDFILDVSLTPLADSEDDCANGFDDDQDGLEDCDDDDCADDVFCVGYPGDNCAQALPINDGKPMGEVDSGSLFSFQGTTEGLLDHYAVDCDPETEGSADAVYFINLSDPMTLSLSYDFEGNAWPALYVLGENCDVDMVYGCATAYSGAANLNITLPAGVFHIVLDAAFEGDEENYSFSVSLALAPQYELECDNSMDDDMDGLVDCEDGDCENETVCIDPYEKNPTLETAWAIGLLPLDGFLSEAGAMVYPAGDEDWFSFSLDAAGFITVSVIPAGDLDVKLALYDGFGVEVATADSGVDGEEETITYGAYEEGKFFLAIEGYQESVGDFLLEVTSSPASITETDCSNGSDDDLDMLIDCDDDDCTDSSLCGGGEACADANLINGGQPIDGTFNGVQFDLEGTTVGYGNDYTGSCSAASANASDAVWKLVLGEPMLMNAQVDYEGYKWPSAYVYYETCGGLEVACGAGNNEPLELEGLFDAGTYYIVVDGNWANDESPYSLTLTFAFQEILETECDDDVDNDQDGKADCADEDCFEDAACSGQNCAFPIQVNDGLAITAADGGLVLSYEGDTTGFTSELAGSCSEATMTSPEAVYELEITDTIFVSISHDFETFFWPAMYVLKDNCATGEEVLCAFAETEPASAEGVLEPGIYYIVVDASFAGDEGPYTLLFEFVALEQTETDCTNEFDDDGDGLEDCCDDDCSEDPGCQEICDDAMDNDCDQDLDCADDDCIGFADCEGESCAQAFLVNNGEAITSLFDGQELSYEGSTVDKLDDHFGSCDEDTGTSPDLVYVMELQEAMVVSISHDFAGYSYPAVYLFSGECLPEQEIACAVAKSDPAVISDQILVPGVYFIVLDASFDGDAADYTLLISLTAIPDHETDCGDGKDNDNDGLSDCCDDDCKIDPLICFEAHCGDNFDNDCDGFVDCDDDECELSAFCVVQSLPYSEDFEADGAWPDGIARSGPNADCDWDINDEGADGSSYSLYMKWGYCSETESYNVFSPWLDLTTCAQISVEFFQKGQYVASYEWHGLGLDDGNVQEIHDVDVSGTEFAAVAPYVFNTLAVDSARVFFAYQGNNADSWWIDQIHVSCSQPITDSEVDCADEFDNDQDDLVDCADDECFADPVCMDSDDDGTVDAEDLCPGEDDKVDVDGNQIPDACEIGWAGDAWPNNGAEVSVSEDVVVYVQVWMAGITEGEGKGDGVSVTLNYKMDGDEDYQTMDMSYNMDKGDELANDEYMAVIPSSFTVEGGTLILDFILQFGPEGLDGVAYVYGDAVTDQNVVGAPLNLAITAPPPIPVEPGDVIFTEVMFNPLALNDSDGEWLEVLNTTDHDIDMEGWILSSSNDDDHVLFNSGNGIMVQSGGYLVLVRTVNALGEMQVPMHPFAPGMNIGNGTDMIALKSGEVDVDAVTWDEGNTFPNPAEGTAIQLSNDQSVMNLTDNDSGVNWCPATVAYITGDFGTPGTANGVCQ